MNFTQDWNVKLKGINGQTREFIFIAKFDHTKEEVKELIKLDKHWKIQSLKKAGK